MEGACFLVSNARFAFANRILHAEGVYRDTKGYIAKGVVKTLFLLSPFYLYIVSLFVFIF